MNRTVALGLALATATLVGGCASAPAPESRPAAGGVAYRDDKELQRVWVAPGFDVKAYDSLYVGETRGEVPQLNPDGVQNFEWAKGVLRDELVAALKARNLFASVVTRETDIRPGSRALRLENTIVEYEKGGGSARWFAGLYGAGQPVIKVRGRLTAEDKPVFLFETRRSGESGSARWLGGYRSDRDIQEEDIRGLARDLAEFIARTAKQ
ncbi:MAG TPA: hypothetical protein VGX21_09760 [Methylomirabilota bacterium]|nr:hypothetical protein [Methylomirabilota bacterium]